MVEKPEKKPLPSAAPGLQTRQLDNAMRMLTRFQRFAWDIGGVLVLALSLMTLLALLLPDYTHGILLTWWADTLWLWLGWGGFWVVFATGVGGYLMLRYSIGDPPKVRWGRIFALEFAVFASLGLLAALGGTSLDRADLGLDGGRIGWALSYLLGLLLSPIGLTGMIWRVILFGGALVVCFSLALGLHRPLLAWAERRVNTIDRLGSADFEPEAMISLAPIKSQEGTTQVGLGQNKKRPHIPIEFRKKFRIQDEVEETPEQMPLPPRDDRLPPLDLLVTEQIVKQDERNINLTAGLIEKTLAEFGIPAKVVGFRIGPTVTQFAVEPGFVERSGGDGEGDINRQKVRVSQISALSRDLALALSAERLRIEAPVPGRPYVGIEVPNTRSTVVRLRPILETEAFYKIGSPLAIALGRDVSGQVVVADLARMPHLLIAGTTGSGKSVCIAALTACLVMNNTPQELRLVMIDPKMVELVRFNGLPHLYGRVETDLERILGVLRWAVSEMDRRYKLLEASHSRNLDSFNRKVRRRKGEEPLPRIVVLIDELADLMMSAPEQTEPVLVRLAQMARATGIHLVLATQRPSTDVVTGLIKANFPARISFAVASSIDSRVILDTNGAETLLGHGDMLFLPPEASGPVRAQGVMVSDPEVERVITFWQNAAPQVQIEPPPWEEVLKQESAMANRDDLIEQAIEIVKETQHASASLLQRRLRIGYPRAARLIDELEELRIVGPSQGGGREREVLIGKEEG
jgi:DNA segregation ATPase FtsK/SpoIIIE, S-DNA-T family